LKRAEILEVEWANVPNLIKTYTDRNFERFEKENYADRFFDYYYVDGSEPDDYKHQIIDLSKGRDLSFYVGLKGNILSIQKPIKYDEVTLVRPENLDFYSLYQGTVEFYIDENPGSEQYVFAQSRKDIERLYESQTLFCPYIDEQWAGVIAVDRSTEKYLEGYLIVEEVIIKKFRGRNFAPAIQHKLIEIMPGDDFTLIYGEIHENNIPSRKTAARNGRIRSGTYYFINI